MAEQEIREPATGSAERMYSPHPWCTDESSGDTRERIIDGARRGMLRFGSEKVSMNDIAKLAGCSRATLYKHFPDREALIQTVVGIVTQAYLDDMRIAMSSRRTLEDQVIAAIWVVRSWHYSSYERFTSFQGLLSPSDLMRILVRTKNSEFQDLISMIRPFVAAAQRRDEIRSEIDTDHAAEWIGRVLTTLTLIRPRTFDEQDPADVERFFRAFVVRGLD